MVNHLRWRMLQMFAGEGAGAGSAGSAGSPGADGGEAATTGDSAAVAGQKRLLELGVPAAKLRQNRVYPVKSQPAAAAQTAQTQAQTQNQEQVAAAQEETPKTEDKPQKPSWDEIKKDPDYNREIQAIVQERLKDAKAAQSAMTVLTPWLKELAKEHKLDPENIDYEALVKSANGEYSSKALELGVSEDTARQLDQQQRTLEQMKFANHMQKLDQQSAAVKAVFPNFDLRTEMQNPTFARLVSPGVNMSVEDAYYAIHRKEIQAASMQVAAQQTAQQISNAIQSGSKRPDESGATASAPSVTNIDYSKMSRAERKALNQRIYAAAARGEKLRPGQI